MKPELTIVPKTAAKAAVSAPAKNEMPFAMVE